MDTDQKESFYIKFNPTTLGDLKLTIREIWCKDIDQNVCKKLTDSMPIAAFRKLLKARLTTPIQEHLLPL